MKKQLLNKIYNGKVARFLIEQEVDSDIESYAVELEDGTIIEFTFDESLVYGLRFYAPRNEQEVNWENWNDPIAPFFTSMTCEYARRALQNWALLAKSGDLGKGTAFTRKTHKPRWRARSKFPTKDYRVHNIEEILDAD
ncbi:hypothetical protein [Ligilactobacillus equi]|uniref:Uncharacterized protein n=1 Tax=Ligilactobacillus equi DPC 6820 TaxID=1392007 RepID=V7HX91_9LACO|nr:hypothetical protein [Ligilactobacillus equi]ETA74512.1 hypothetical protein LEQ_0377 [Ligilactobacillus equi DPC 6820]